MNIRMTNDYTAVAYNFAV